MDEKQLLEAFPEAERSPGADWLPLIPAGVNVGIKSYQIEGTDYTVIFIPDKTGLLERVSIAPHNVKGPGGLPTSPPVMERLEALLVDKYGRPTVASEETKAGLRTTVRSWVFQHTIIDLHRIDELRVGFSHTSLDYRKNTDADKL